MLTTAEMKAAITTLAFLNLTGRKYALYGAGKVASQLMDAVESNGFLPPVFVIDSKYTYASSFRNIPLVSPGHVADMPKVDEIVLATNRFAPDMRMEMQRHGIPLSPIDFTSGHSQASRLIAVATAFRHGPELLATVRRFVDNGKMFAFYGAGKFCRSMLCTIATAGRPPPKWIFDDNPTSATLLSIPVVRPSDIPEIDEIVVASDTFAATIRRRVQDVFRGRLTPRVLGDSPHGFVYDDIRLPSRYSPWNGEAAFVTAHNKVARHTLVDKYRCYELWQLVAQSAKLGRGAILEVGVWRGGTGTLMAMQARRCGIADNVYLCDTFAGVVKAGGTDTFYSGGEHANTSKDVVEELLRETLDDLKSIHLLKGIFPDDTASLIPVDEQFRFCHIDVDVYESASAVLAWLWDRLIPGGIVVFDDYGWKTTPGVTLLVNEHAMLKDRIVMYNLNGHAVMIKLPAPDISPALP